IRVISRITDSGNFWTRSESRGSSIARSARPPPPVGAMRLPPAREGRGPQKPVGPALRTGIAIRGEVPSMSERFFDFWRVDVFTDTPLAGDPLAVFHRATGLSPAEMLGGTPAMDLPGATLRFPPGHPP